MSFEQAVQFVRTPNANMKPTQAQQLEFYALYKQATEGDAKASTAGMLDFSGQAKHKAWAAKAGMSKGDAEAAYVKALGSVCPTWA